jgi:outer membrane protein assembly factor BamB
MTLRRWARAFALSLLLVSSAAPHGQQASARQDAWTMFRAGPALTGRADTTLASPLKLAWSYHAQDAVASSAAIVDGVVYFGSRDGVLHAIDLATGKARWQYATNSSIEESSPAVHNGLVFVGDMDGAVHAVDAKTGKARWTFKTEGEVHSSPNVSGDRLFIGSYDEHLYCLWAGTGTLIWKFATAGPVHSTPSIDKDTVFVSGCDEQLRGIDVATGKERLSVPMQNYSGASAAVIGSDAYVGTFGNEVLGIDLARRAVRWRYRHKAREMPFYSSAAVASDRLVLGGRDKVVHCLARSTGKALWTFATRARVDSSPLIVDGRVFVGSSDGNLYELDLATGRKVWEFTAGSAVTASPAAAAGALIIGAQDGTVFCLR